MRPRLTGLVRLGLHRRAVGALALTIAAPVLAGCTSGSSGTTASDVAWVATGASVTLPGSGVTPVDLGQGRPEEEVFVGSLPTALAYTPGDRGLLAVAQGDDTLSEIDPATHDVIHTVGVGLEPDAVAVAPGGTRGKGIALVANFGSNSVTPVDLGTWRTGRPISVGKQPVAIAVWTEGPRAATAFVADFGSDQVTPISVPGLSPGLPVDVGPSPQTAVVSKGEVLVGNFGNHTLSALDAATRHVLTTVLLPFNPTGLVATPSGRVYACGGAAVAEVTATGFGPVVGTTLTLPGVAQGIALDRRGTTATVSMRSGYITEVDLLHDRVMKKIELGGHPSAIVVGSG
jgi:YVTN family beta-propeller protein